MKKLTIYLLPLHWQLWPVWSKSDPHSVFLGPIVIQWDLP